MIQASQYKSPLGALTLIHDNSYLMGLDFSDNEMRLDKLMQRYHDIRNFSYTEISPTIKAYFDAYFEAPQTTPHFPLKIKTGGTIFQQEVWEALATIPLGQTTSYQQLAQKINKPRAIRAVGAANGANPISIIIPCHRVIGHDGSLTGYAGGLQRKAWLLNHESLLASA